MDRLLNGHPPAGFRLHRLELMNWGTFSGLHVLEMDGHTSLLTGENGSGKSTLVDALLTLLVPNQQRNYNQAAGANRKRERSELSYVRGAYGKLRSEADYDARTQYLRDEKSYSVLLAHFHNEGYGQDVTLAQLFWLQNTAIKKFFVVATRPLTLAEHFAGQPSIRALRSALSKLDGVTVEEQFVQYDKRFRKLFRLRSHKALDLFNQTVTIKEIGELNSFVRQHMLEETAALTKIAQLQEHYENLTLAYNAIQKAEQQLLLLRPVAEEGKRYHGAQSEVATLQECERVMPAYFASHRLRLLQQAIAAEQGELAQTRQRLAEVAERVRLADEQRLSLRLAIGTDETGQRLRDLDQRIDFARQECERKQAAAKEYAQLALGFELPDDPDEATFHRSRQQAQGFRTLIEQQLAALDEKLRHLPVELDKTATERESIRREVASLRARNSQIPEPNQRVRSQILSALAIPEAEIPFVGELLKVKEEARAWEGAIERLLHHLGLRLLVPAQHYQRVKQYMNENHLGGRVVFHHLPEQPRYTPHPTPEPHFLFHKLEIKQPRNRYHAWIENELLERFPYVCCEDNAEFERSQRAITPNGLIKGGNEQHEKDDRRRIDDRRHYILGWNNADKVQLLVKALQEVEQHHKQLEREMDQAKRKQSQTYAKRAELDRFLRIERFQTIDWRTDAQTIQGLEEEKKRLVESSNQLRALQQELEQAERLLGELTREQNDLRQQEGRLTHLLEQHERERADSQAEVQRTEPALLHRHLPRLQALTGSDLTLALLHRVSNEVAQKVRDEMAVSQKRVSSYEGRLMRAMQLYKSAFPTESSEFDASVEAIDEFERELKRVEQDDLPQYKERFKGLRDEKIVANMSILRADLDGYEDQIRQSIDELNRSLRKIHYSPDTYIELKSEPSQDQEISAFKRDLKACLPDVGQLRSDAELEASYERIRKLLSRFKEDARWTQKVTDVRYWLSFAAVERYHADDSQKHYYSDSSGKSGGQKAKLAYTILASAIAFQFGLEMGERRSQALRFVVVDEAFSRSDENNSRYAMQLFKQLDLQLLVVTPMTGIHIVEPFIATCHFVWNNSEGNNSQVMTMSVHELQQKREQHQRMQRDHAAGD